MSHNNHLSKLISCYSAPPEQEAVGSAPEKFILELGDSYASSLKHLPDEGKKPLNRTQVRAVCQDTQIDELVAYCVVMRWGGRNPQNFRLSIAGDSRDKLKGMLERLRGSTQTRIEDFDEVQKASCAIKGLGISFYTKLLFFFRSQEDAYILDQWTAKSASLLFDSPPVKLASTHFPSPATTPKEYEDFCTRLEALRTSFSPAWTTGEEVERALFSAPGKDWRLHVKKQFPAAPPQKAKEPKIEPSAPTASSSQKVKLAQMIAALHEKTAMEDISLPAETASVTNCNSGQPRVYCGRCNGLNWQYNVNANSIVVQANLYNRSRDPVDDLRNAFGLAPGQKDFGDGIEWNGKGVIQIKILKGASSDDSQWCRIAEEAISEMNRLHERITAFLL